MLKFHAALTTGLATLLVAPAALDNDELATLDAALRSTSRALDVVTGVERQVAEDPTGSVSMLRQVTEAPLLDPARRDERLATLRDEVNLLRTELDQLELSALERGLLRPDGTLNAGVSSAAPVQDQGTRRPLGTPGTLDHVSTGLDDQTRSALESARNAALRRAGEAVPTSDEEVDTPDDYSANPLRHARTCYRAGRYAEGRALLSEAEDPESLFWRARCSERMGDLESADADLRQLLAQDPEGPFAERAQADLEFVQWKRDFLERMESRK